jgi:ribose transport system ATP-binding protein
VIGVERVSKAFGETRALDDVSIELRPGEVHALVGGNGSGKSTLVKVLAGVVLPDAGVLRGDGGEQVLRGLTPAGAHAWGLRFVHQEPSVFADLTIADNLCLGHGFARGRLGRVRDGAIAERAAELMRRFEVSGSPDRLLGDLRPAEQTMIAIARALQDQDDARDGVLVLDEPTAALPPAEASLLLEALKRYASRGQAILFVSHRLDEVLDVASRVTVLRDGRKVATVERSKLDHERLVELILGRALETLGRSEEPQRTRLRLFEADRLSGGVVADASLQVERGEVVGLAGIAGSGCSTVLRMIFGAQRVDAGRMLLDGLPLAPSAPAEAMRRRVAYVPPDRAARAVFPELSVGENLTIASIRDYSARGRLRLDAERRDVASEIGDYGIVARAPDAPIADLSGGNQQKVVIARWLRRRPRLLLLDEPTQGVDVGARSDLWDLIHAVAGEGSGVLVASSDVEELALACHRVVVMRRGRSVDQIAGDALTADALVDALHQAEVPA